MKEISPLLCSIKQNSLDDGPGIRTVLFFKGCPLRCSWCQNPEAQDVHQELVFDAEKCIRCNPCGVNCPTGAFSYKDNISLNWDKCELYYNCVESCPADVFKKAGIRHEIKDIVNLARENKVFFNNSGGGITLTGGEPLLFPSHVKDLVDALKVEGINIVLETCGKVKLTARILSILEKINLIYYDLKIINPEKHLRYTRAGNELILKNLKFIVENSLAILPGETNMIDFKKNVHEKPLLVPRIPLVPGITATRENLLAIRDYLLELGFKLVDLLPYNPLWLEKARTLKKDITYSRDTWMEDAELNLAREIFEGFQFETFK